MFCPTWRPHFRILQYSRTGGYGCLSCRSFAGREYEDLGTSSTTAYNSTCRSVECKCHGRLRMDGWTARSDRMSPSISYRHGAGSPLSRTSPFGHHVLIRENRHAVAPRLRSVARALPRTPLHEWWSGVQQALHGGYCKMPRSMRRWCETGHEQAGNARRMQSSLSAPSCADRCRTPGRRATSRERAGCRVCRVHTSSDPTRRRRASFVCLCDYLLRRVWHSSSLRIPSSLPHGGDVFLCLSPLVVRHLPALLTPGAGHQATCSRPLSPLRHSSNHSAVILRYHSTPSHGTTRGRPHFLLSRPPVAAAACAFPARLPCRGAVTIPRTAHGAEESRVFSPYPL